LTIVLVGRAKSILFTGLGILFCTTIFGQAKVSVSISNPSSYETCIPSDYVSISIRNITTSTLTGVECEVDLPTGTSYLTGSLNGAGITEKNITNLNKPVFDLGNIGVASAKTIQIRVSINCDIINFLNNGGFAVISTNTYYPGGSIASTSSPMRINQPSLQIDNITNQLVSVNRKETFVRAITLKNAGNGKLQSAQFIRINGSGLSVIGVSGNTTTRNDSILLALDSSAFVGVGNGDKYLDLNETITFYDTLQVDECSNLSTRYTATWGCEGSNCQVATKLANATISNISPNLRITPIATTNVCMGTSQEQKLILVNIGNDTARNVVAHILNSVNGGFNEYVFSRLEVDSIYISSGMHTAKSSISPWQTYSSYNLGKWSCLGNDPKGAFKLRIQDLGPGDSTVIHWKSKTCCADDCNQGTFYTQRWRYSAEYYDQCEQLITTNEQWGSTGFYQGVTLTKELPTDISGSETKQLAYIFTNGSLLPPQTSAKTRVELILPDGVTHSLNTSDLRFRSPLGTYWTPNKLTRNGDTVNAIFYGAPNIVLLRSELAIKIKGDCNGFSTNEDLDLKLSLFYIPDTTCNTACNMKLYCTTDKLRIHCSSSCNAGMHFNGFSIERVSYGEPDNDNNGEPDASGSIDFDKIKTNRSNYGDTLKATFRGRVYNASSTTNWYYGKATSHIRFGTYLDVEDVRIKIYRNGRLLYNCNNINYSESTSGLDKTFEFDIGYLNLLNSGCAVYTNFSYGRFDSLELDVTYVVARNPGNAARDMFLTNNFYLSTVSNPSASQRYQCDTFSGIINLQGQYYLNYAKAIYNSAGCNTINTSQNFYLSVGRCCSNYAGGNMFPFEYRPWARLKEIVVHKPVGLDLANTRIIQYRTQGTGTRTYEQYLSVNPTSLTPTTITYATDSLYTHLGGNIKTSDDGFLGIMYQQWKPNCKLSTANYTIDYDFVFERLGVLSQGLDTVSAGTTYSDEINYTQPKIAIIPADNNVTASSDTVEWTVRLNNLSPNTSAPNVWLSAPKSTNINLVEVLDLATNSAVIKSGDIYQLGDLSSTAFRDFKVRAIYNWCDFDSLDLRLGFDCSGYPDSLAAYECITQNTWLYYTPQNTRLDARIVDTGVVVDLCEIRPYTVEIRNTSEPKVYQTYLDLQLRPGMELGDTAWVKIQGRSDSFYVLNPKSLGNNTYRWEIAEYDSKLKNEGFNGTSSTNGNSLLIRFNLKTNCNYTSSSFFIARAGGTIKCGKAVNAPFAVGSPIDIKGVVKPYFAAIKTTLPELDVCNFQNMGSIKFLNLGPDSTGNVDRIRLILPVGISVDTTYTPSGINAPGKASKDPDENNGFIWKIPSGLASGDSSVFSFVLTADEALLECGTEQMLTQSVISQEVVCIENNQLCEIDVATSSDLKADSVRKSNYTLAVSQATSTPNNNNEAINLNYRIANTGIPKLQGDPLYVRVVADTNKNNIIDSSDVTLFIDTVTNALAANTPLTRNIAFLANSKFACNLFLYVSNENCVCEETQLQIPPPQLLNAGKDSLICPKTPIAIGLPGNTSNTYLWSPSAMLNRSDSSGAILFASNPSTEIDTVVLTLTTTRGGCSSTDTVQYRVHPEMQINLNHHVNLCAGDSVIIGSVAQGGTGRLKTYSWQPNYELSRPTGPLTYAGPDTTTTYYYASTDDVGCVLRDSVLVEVKAKPSASFSFKDTCAQSVVQFTNTTDYNKTTRDSISWQFGNIFSSQQNNPSLFIDSGQSILVSFYVRSTDGCWDTTSANFTAWPLPKVNYTLNNSCALDTTALVASSTIKNGTVSHQWEISNQTLVGDSIPVFLPNQTELPFNLKAISDRGCTREVRDTILIYAKPAIEIQASDECEYDSVSASINNLNGTPLTDYQWDLGDGTSDTTSQLKHLYPSEGGYTLQAIAFSSFGCSDTAQKEITIHPQPKDSFAVESVCLGDSILVTSFSSSSAGSITTYWDIGNGFESGDSIQSFLFNQIGTYTIHHKTVSSFGCTDSSSQQASIFYVDEPSIAHTGNCVNELVLFNAIDAEPDSIVSHRWVIATDTIRTPNTNYQFGAPGTYTVSLQTTTNNGCTSDTSSVITIDSIPNATINYAYPCSDNVVSFASNYPSNTWDLGDGTTSNNQNLEHTYTALGTYDVELISENSFGCKDTATLTITIQDLVLPKFTVDSVCLGDSILITDLTTGYSAAISAITYAMGDGNSRSSINPLRYAYDAAGTYTITQTVTTLPGCSYTSNQETVVYPLPNPAFSLLPEEADIFDAEITVQYNGSGADSVWYELSDRSVYESYDFTHRFSDSGWYTITQKLLSSYGCFDSLTKQAYINFAYKLFIANAFSPNGDNLNDEFKPLGMGLKSYELHIYNRWGEKLFEGTNEAWTGKDAIPGVYMYRIKARDFDNNVHYYNGTITLLR
jgi:PKD repeat protein